MSNTLNKILAMKVKGNRIMVEPLSITSETIVIPQNAESALTGEYVVRTVGDGEKIPQDIKVGSVVAMMPIGCHRMVVRGEDGKRPRVFCIYSAEDVIGIFPDEPEAPAQPEEPATPPADGTIIIPGNFGN